jgi:hypothetical protein
VRIFAGKPLNLGEKKRGKIAGFSPHAAGRCRAFCVTMDVPGRTPIAVSLTTRGMMTPKAWRAAWKRLRMRAKRLGVPFVWRVELQRRKTPHVHLVAWIRPGRQGALDTLLFREGWLECVREQDDPASRRYAAKIRKVENHGWLVYVALHHGKHKREQLGWEGKQWGIVNRGLFVRRVSHDVDLNWSQYHAFIRIARRLVAVAGRRARPFSCRTAQLRCHSSKEIERALAWVKSAVRETASESDAKQVEASAVGA